MSLPDNVRFFVADTETTGAQPEDKVVELGWIEVDEVGNVLSETQSLIDPQRPISPGASGVHGLVNRDVEDSPTIEEYFSVDDPSCYGHLMDMPMVLIGHRIGFDTRYLGPYFPNILQELCTLRWARRIYPYADDHKLSTLMFALDLPRPQNAHRVMGDIYSALYLAQHLCKRTGMNFRQMAEASAAPMMLTHQSFGKHKGELFTDTPKPYLRWQSENLKDQDMDLRFTLESLLYKNKNKVANDNQSSSLVP